MGEDRVEIGEYGWNDDPAWVDYIQRFESVIRSIVTKFTTDESLRDDCAQEARIGLMKTWPEKIRGYETYVAGEITEDEWNDNLDKYCRNVIRNRVLGTLEDLRKGNWYVGRTRRRSKKKGSGVHRYRIGARYVPLEDLVELGGMQIDDQGNVIWGPSHSRMSEDEFWTEGEVGRRDDATEENESDEG